MPPALRLMLVALLASAFVLPVDRGWLNATTALMALAAIFAGRAFWHQTWHLVRSEPLLWWAWGLFGWMLLAVLWAEPDARWGRQLADFLRLLLLPMLAVAVARLRPARLFDALVLGCIASGILVLLRLGGVLDLDPRHSFTSINRIAYGIACAFALFYLLLRITLVAGNIDSRRWLDVGAVAAIAMLVAFANDGRSGILLVLMFGIATLMHAPMSLARRLSAAGLIAVLTAGLVAASPQLRHRVQQGTLELNVVAQADVRRDAGALAETSVGQRLTMLTVAADLVQERPLLGHGTGGFGPAFEDWQRRWIGEVRHPRYLDPHNDFLSILVQQGVPGLVLLIMFYAAILRTSRRSADRTTRAFGTGVAGFLVVAGMINSVWGGHAEGWLTTLAVAALIAAVRDEREGRRAWTYDRGGLR